MALNALFYETSAKANTNVEEMFFELTNSMRRLEDARATAAAREKSSSNRALVPAPPSSQGALAQTQAASTGAGAGGASGGGGERVRLGLSNAANTLRDRYYSCAC